MNENRLQDYIEHIQQAVTDACSFVEGLAKDDFDIDLDVVWETTQAWLPELLRQLPALRQDADFT